MGSIIKAIVGAVVDIIGAVIDLVVDIIEIAFDIIETFIDFVIDIIEAIVDAIASLLGFGDQIVEQFDVHNQPLFDDPDKNVMAEIIVDSILKEEDIAANILYAEAFQSGKQNIKRFASYIDDDKYFEGFATVEANILNVDHGAVTDTLSTINGTPCSIEKVRLGLLTVDNWTKYWLQEYKGYSVESNRITVNGVTGSFSDALYVDFTDTYRAILVGPTKALETNIGAIYVGPGIAYSLDIGETLFASTDSDYITGTTNKELTLSATFTYTLPDVIPTKPTGVCYTVEYYRYIDPLNTRLFVYKQGEGTYYDLDNSGLEFDASSEDEVKILPAIPLRIDNANFNATETAKTVQVRELVEKLGLDADILIKNIMEDVADSGIDDYENKVDHVFLNFGMRLWDTSQSGLTYLYRMFSLLHVAQASTEGTYLSTPDADEKPYNNLVITATDYKSVFKFAYVKFNHYTLAEVDANSTSTINGVYYSDLSKFNYNDLTNKYTIRKTYYVSSRQSEYNVGYIATGIGEVNQFIAGTLPRQSSYLETVKDYLQVTRRLNYSGSLKDAASNVITDGALKPSLVYKVDGSGLQLILRIGENVTSHQEITYYQCVENGLNSLTIKAPIGALRVVDGATDKFKMVKSNLADEDALMIPLSYDLIKDLPNRDVTNMILASAHVSIYVAHYEVISVPFWLKLLQVVLIVLAVMSLMTGNLTLADSLLAMAKYVVKQMIIKAIIVYIAKEISPELAMIVAIMFGIYNFNQLSGTAGFSDIAQIFGETADLIGNVVGEYVEGENHLLQNTYEEILQEFEDSMNYLKTLRQEMGLDEDGGNFPEITHDTRGSISAMSPDAYYLTSITNKYEIAFMDYDYDNKFTQIYDKPQLT